MPRLAARETIARGQYEASVSGASGRLSRAEEENIEDGRAGALKRKNHRTASTPYAPRRARERPSGIQNEPPAKLWRPQGRDRRRSLPTQLLPAASGVCPHECQFDQREHFCQKYWPPEQLRVLQTELADLEIEPFRQNLAITEEPLENSRRQLRKIRRPAPQGDPTPASWICTGSRATASPTEACHASSWCSLASSGRADP